MSITAAEAGKSLRVIGEKMLAAGIVTAEGSQVLIEESYKLAKLKTGRSWTTQIARGRPISFERVQDKNGAPLSITISADRIVVAQADDLHPPFSNLDIAVYISDPLGEPICRWHLDRANVGQPGPRFHLQMGGHLPGFRDRELPVAEPRWCHPPMELGLLCEVISANFFEALWAQALRDDPAWCHAIRDLQHLCYSAYSTRLAASLDISDSTALTRMWNDRWI